MRRVIGAFWDFFFYWREEREGCLDAAGVREKSGWFAAGAVALDGPIAAAFWSFSVCHSVEVPLVCGMVCAGYGCNK